MGTKQTTRLSSDEVKEVGFAEDFKEDVMQSPVLRFEDDELEDTIMEADDDELLVVTSSINSPKTVKEVIKYDEQFSEAGMDSDGEGTTVS